MAKQAPGRIAHAKYDRLEKLIKDLGKKVTIKVGIIGEKAAEIHPGTHLTMAQLGAIHEFGATIPVTAKMRGWFYNNFEINKSSKAIVIPTRSFLRMPILADNGKSIKKDVVEELNKDILGTDREMNLKAWGKDHYLKSICFQLAIKATERVIEAFDTGGFGKWAAITEFTKQNRKENPETPPLTDTGALRQSIAYEIKGL